MAYDVRRFEDQGRNYNPELSNPLLHLTSRDFARLARENEALLYIDDAHGFGVIGERAPDESSPYGKRGNGVVRHFGETYDDIVFVSGLSKSYSSLLAFVACSQKLKDGLKVVSPPYLYSCPSPVASLATTLTGLKVNAERGDEIRADLFRKTRRVLDQVEALGIATPNNSGFPIIPGCFDLFAGHLHQGSFETIPMSRVVVRELTPHAKITRACLVFEVG